MRYAISSSVKVPMQVDSPLCTHLVEWGFIILHAELFFFFFEIMVFKKE